MLAEGNSTHHLGKAVLEGPAPLYRSDFVFRFATVI